MGLSASQARLLNLTARMHDIEYKAQNLEAQKLQMANESTQVYQEYENALNKQKVQFKQIGTDGSANYIDASLQTLLSNGYKLKIWDGSTYVDIGGISGTTLQSYTDTEENFANAYVPANAKVGDIVTVGDKTFKLTKLAEGSSKGSGQGLTDVSGDLAKITDFTSTDVLRNLVEAGYIVFQKPDSEKGFTEVNIATDTSLQEVSDEVELKKAEAKYEADMRKINQKDKKFDTDLAAMDAERNAIKTEMDTLKTVAKENVDRTFKLFS